MRRFSLLVLAAGAAFGQVFEVATIRNAELDLQKLAANRGAAINLSNIGLKVNGNQVNIGFVSLRDLVTMAYEVKPTQVKAPDWMAQQRYDIQALMPEGSDQKQLPAMLQAMLKDRFKLVAHKDSKEQDVMALEVAKGGHKMKEAAPVDPNAVPAPPPPGAQTITAGGQSISISPGARAGANTAIVSTSATGAMKMSMGQDGQMHMEVERMTMQMLADQLTQMNELPVVDRTGLTGAFQVSLDLSMADLIATARRVAGATGVALPAGIGGATGMPAGLNASDPGGDLNTTVGKLGLRLEKTKQVMESLTVESAEKTPSEN